MRKRNSTINQITLIGKTLKREHQFANGNVRLICRRVLPVSVIWLFATLLLGFLFLSPELFARVSAEDANHSDSTVLQVNYPPILGASLYLATPPA
jgi:hypothetical protein